jgi:hypothetical protein
MYLPSFIRTTSSMTSLSRLGNMADKVLPWSEIDIHIVLKETYSTTSLCSARWIFRASAASALACRAAAS